MGGAYKYFASKCGAYSGVPLLLGIRIFYLKLIACNKVVLCVNQPWTNTNAFSFESAK